MKIGIMTWYYGYNYGAKAHSYALMKTVEALGYSCEMIQFVPKGTLRIQIRSNISFENKYKHPILLFRVLIKCFKFQNSLKHYKQSKRFRGALEIDQSRYDKIILGSDEILNLLHPMFNKIYYGVDIKTQKLLYAPSSGQTNENTKLPKECVNSLYECTGLSARDKHTEILIQNNVNRNVEHVLDPTLLYDFNDIGVPSWKHKNYILIYSFDPLTEYRDRIMEYAQIHNLKVFSLGRYSNLADKSFDTASFELWVEMFRHASVVITDSFHGTVFAIKNKKPFVICSREDKVNKIIDLMKDLELNKRFYKNEVSIEEYLKIGIDYEKVYQIIEEKKKMSINYLSTYLSK